MSDLHSQFNIIITRAVESSINTYAELISKKFNLNSSEIKNIWYNSENNKQVIENKVENNKQVIENKVEELDDDQKLKLMKSSVAELKAMCKKKGYKVSGKKADLIHRLLNGEDVKKKVKKNTVKEVPKIIKKLSDNISTIQIRKNQFGNFEHSETKFIFNKETQQVIGKQNEDGTIDDLEKSDVELCHKFKFKYIIPENLNKNNNDDINLDEMELEDDDETNESSEEEELEELEDDDLSDFYE